MAPAGTDVPRLKAKVALFERLDEPRLRVLPFGDARIDRCLPQGGLPLGRLHEIASEKRDSETPAAASSFAAYLAQRTARQGVVVWALQRDDLYAPGLQVFAHADRLILARANKDAEVFAVLEDALSTRGVGAAIGEVSDLTLLASRRLELACERSDATCFALRRRLYASPQTVEVSSVSTRWRIATALSEPNEPGLGHPRWRVHLERCRGGRTGAWIMEAQDATGDVRVVAELADHAAETNGTRLEPRPGDDGVDRQRASPGSRR